MNPRYCFTAIAFLALTGLAAAQGHSQDKGHGHGKGHDEKVEYVFTAHDRDEAREWYRGNEGSLPPGLAKKDRLPPGLEKQLVRRGTLPPGLQKKIQPCPVELERRLPPPPPGGQHVLIGGHLVLINRNTHVVLDVREAIRHTVYHSGQIGLLRKLRASS